MSDDATRPCVECDGRMSPVTIMDKAHYSSGGPTSGLDYRLPDDTGVSGPANIRRLVRSGRFCARSVAGSRYSARLMSRIRGRRKRLQMTNEQTGWIGNQWSYRSPHFWCGLYAGIGMGLLVGAALVELELLTQSNKAWVSVVGILLFSFGCLVAFLRKRRLPAGASSGGC